MDIRTPRIITGKPFDWESGARAAAHVVSPDGDINWMAASAADPGVTQCPKCEAWYWREGEDVECLDCGTQWNVNKRRSR
jgi:hypothetical protein